MSRTLIYYPLEYYKCMFTEERWFEINNVLDNWENPILADGTTFKTLIRNPETGVCFNAPELKENIKDHSWDFYKKSVLEKYLTEEEFELCNKNAYNRHSEEAEERRFQQAEKIKEEDYGDNPVFANDEFHYGGIGEMKEFYDAEDIPLYVYGVVEHDTLHNEDLRNMLSSHFENIDVEDMESPMIPEYLKNAWEKFVSEKSQLYFTEDRKTVILIDTKLEDKDEDEE